MVLDPKRVQAFNEMTIVAHAHSLGLIPARLRRYKNRIKYT